MIGAAELLGSLDRHDVSRFLDDADHRAIAPLIQAELTQLTFGDVEAATTPGDLLLDLDDRRCESARVFRRDPQDVERDALGRLGSDARKPTELIDQALDRAGVDRGHAVSP